MIVGMNVGDRGTCVCVGVNALSECAMCMYVIYGSCSDNPFFLEPDTLKLPIPFYVAIVVMHMNLN